MTENPLKEVEKQSYEMEISLIQPWSVPVLKTKLPPDILQIMTKISDQIIADKKAENYGPQLVGQIEKELKIENTILEQTGVISFFLEAVRQFVIHCKCQMIPTKIVEIQQEIYGK